MAVRLSSGLSPPSWLLRDTRADADGPIIDRTGSWASKTCDTLDQELKEPAEEEGRDLVKEKMADRSRLMILLLDVMTSPFCQDSRRPLSQGGRTMIERSSATFTAVSRPGGLSVKPMDKTPPDFSIC
ncbi:unnamed protein product, partial [Mesorhabditis spiculigera]